MLGRIFYSIPVIGWLVRDAVHGTDEAKYFFFFNVFVVLAGAIYAFGYPLAIVLALIGTALGLSWIVLLSMGDVIERLMTQTAADAASVPSDAALEPVLVPVVAPARRAA